MKLDIIFTAWGSPETLASDNGPQFKSNQFQDWCRLNGIFFNRFNKIAI